MREKPNLEKEKNKNHVQIVSIVSPCLRMDSDFGISGLLNGV